MAKGAGSMVAECSQAAPGGDSGQKKLFEVKAPFRVERISLEDKDTSADIETLTSILIHGEDEHGTETVSGRD